MHQNLYWPLCWVLYPQPIFLFSLLNLVATHANFDSLAPVLEPLGLILLLIRLEPVLDAAKIHYTPPAPVLEPAKHFMIHWLLY